MPLRERARRRRNQNLGPGPGQTAKTFSYAGPRRRLEIADSRLKNRLRPWLRGVADPCSPQTIATQEGFEVPRGVHDPKNFHSLQLWTVEYQQPLEARYSKHPQRREQGSSGENAIPCWAVWRGVKTFRGQRGGSCARLGDLQGPVKVPGLADSGALAMSIACEVRSLLPFSAPRCVGALWAGSWLPAQKREQAPALHIGATLTGPWGTCLSGKIISLVGKVLIGLGANNVAGSHRVPVCLRRSSNRRCLSSQ